VFFSSFFFVKDFSLLSVDFLLILVQEGAQLGGLQPHP